MEPLIRPSIQSIFIAAKEGNLDFLKNNRAFINSVNKHKETLCHYAASGNQLEVLKWLISNNCAHINQKNSAGLTPLYYAASLGHLEVVEWFFQCHPPIINNSEKKQSLFYAIISGDLTLLSWFIKHHKGYFSSRWTKNMSVLHYAARYGSLETLQWLLSNRTELNLNPQDKEAPFGTPLAYAIQAENLEMVKWLLEESGLTNLSDPNDPSCINEEGELGPIEIAGMTGNIAMLDYLSKHYIPIFPEESGFKTALHYAAEQGHLEAVQWILEEHGLDEESNSRVNLNDDIDYPPLFYAVDKAHIEVAKFLIEEGADLSYVNGEGLNVFTVIGNERRLASDEHKLMYFYLLNETQKQKLTIGPVFQQRLTDWKEQLIKDYMNIFPLFLEHFPKEIAHTVIFYSGISSIYFFNDIEIMALLSPPKCRIEVENPTKVAVVPPNDLDEQETTHQPSASLKRPRDEEEQPNKRTKPSLFTAQPIPQQNNTHQEEESSSDCPTP